MRNQASVAVKKIDYDENSQGRHRSDVDTDKGTILMLEKSRQGTSPQSGVEGSKDLAPTLQSSYP